MTDKELRDAAVAALKRTTVSYPEWLRRVAAGKYRPTDGSTTEWGVAFAALAKIGASPPPPNVTSRSELDVALANLKPGDRLVCSGFTIAGQLNLHHQLAGPADIDFGDVRFVGGGARDLNAVWARAKNLRLFGGILSNPTGHGILFHESQDVLWHGFKVDGVAGTCLRVFTVNADSYRLDLDGEVTRCGGDLSLDPHVEKGTGLHPSYIGGVSSPSQRFKVRDSRFVINAHDCPTGSNQIGSHVENCDFRYTARNLTKVAINQVAGNAVQLFSYTQDAMRNLTIWVEASNVARVVDVDGMGALSSNVRVTHGRGTNVRLAPAYEPNSAVSYVDCQWS